MKLGIQIKNKLVKKLIDKYQWLGYFISWNDGFIHDKETEKDHIFGATTPIIKEDGQWSDLPTEEAQKSKLFDSYACTNFGTENAIVTFVRAILKVIWNKNESFNAVGSGTVPGRGNSIANACEEVRKWHGMINQEDRPLPVDFKRSDFYAPLTQDQINKGKMWLTEYEFKYSRVYASPQGMMNALKHSPLIVGGYAWYQKNGLYKSIGGANHCFAITGFVEGKYWKAFDSYSPYEKKLDWNFKFVGVRSVYLKKKDIEFNQTEINHLKKQGYKYIIRPQSHGEIYELSDNGLKYISASEWNNLNVQQSAENKELIGINEKYYLELIK